MGIETRIRSRKEKLAIHESRDFRSYHAFLRASRRYMEGSLFDSMKRDFEDESAKRFSATRNAPVSFEEAREIADDLPQFQLYQWMFRHLQQFKYFRNNMGIVQAVERESANLVPQLEESAGRAGDRLRLNPEIPLPDYYRMVDFHQQPGGVWGDPAAGLIYELGRRTTVPSHADPTSVYQYLFDQLPKGKIFKRVLDWGTGVGTGIIKWKQSHPHSECYGVDIAAPCLKVAHRRTREAGLRINYSQQDLEHLDFDDNTFDLAFHMFMLHEIPANKMLSLLKEACRVLRGRGLFAGPEFHRAPGDILQNVLQESHAWTNNETYASSWFKVPIEEIAKEAGFSKVSIQPFDSLIGSVRKPGNETRRPTSYWNLYVFEK